MNKPILSIIIPCYNLEETLLNRCIVSILEQGLNDGAYEIIVVDDGSTIRPHHTKNHFADKNMIHWHFNEHIGLGGSRNYGLTQARGEYILFLDADDYLYENTLLPIFNKIKDIQCDILRFNYKFCTSVERECPTQPSSPTFTKAVDGNTYMKLHNLPGMATVYLFRKVLSSNIGLKFPEKGFIEDEAFTTILHHNAQSIVETDINVYAYYKRADSITLTPSVERQSELIHYLFLSIEKIHSYRNEQQLCQCQTDGLERKLNSLAVDIIRRITTHEHWKTEWAHYAPLLQSLHLFPLRRCNYTAKYVLFSYLANNSLGRLLIRFLLKHHIH